LFGYATAAKSQDVPKATLFAGYSYMHGLPTEERVSLNGWAAGFDLNLTRRLGIAVDLSGDYGASSVVTGSFQIVPSQPGSSTVSVPTVSVARTEVSILKHSILLGPEFRVWQKRRATVTLMAGIGAARYTLDSPVFLFTSLNTKPELAASNGFASGGGIGVDIRLTRRVSYRLLQSRFVAARVEFGNSGWQRSIQLATGLVIDLVK
jgi:hypothetical protein